MKREIMKRAHEIARTLEGHYIARLALALRMAWSEARKPQPVKFVVGISRGRAYVAKIVGTHPRWKLDRVFLRPDEKNRSWSGKNGTDVFYVTEDGIYEKAQGSDREYFVVENGVAKQIDLGTVLSLVG